MDIYGKLSGGDIPLPKIYPTVVAACQNMNNATLNLAKVTTLSDPNLTNAVVELLGVQGAVNWVSYSQAIKISD
jgi:hypothetical protein